MVHILAMGGGEIRQGETLPFDVYIASSSGIMRPKVTFLPTASGDSSNYYTAFVKLYSNQLNCDVRLLPLTQHRPSERQIRSLIDTADVIYVGGGNSRAMIRLWKSYGVDKMLIEAAHHGAMLCGLSAGAICWFQYGNSDAPQIERTSMNESNTVRVEGLGLIPGTCCPHMKSEPYRWREFERMVIDMPSPYIALDDFSAIEISGAYFRALSTHPEHAVYRLVCHQGQMVKEKLPCLQISQSDQTALLTDAGFQPIHILQNKALLSHSESNNSFIRK